MSGSRLSGPPSYYESYPYATPEKEPQFLYHSTYRTNSTGMASSGSVSSSGDPRTADIKQWSGQLERMQDARMDKQRYVMSGHKSEEVSMLALGAKVERALARRMVEQDASFRPKESMSSKKMDEEKRKPQVKAK